MPGDKSISHRALMLGGIAEGRTEITGFLPGEDCHATLGALRAMGVTVEQHTATRLSVHGVGTQGLSAPARVLDMGNSGTAMRLFMGLLAGQRFGATLAGDASLTRRPMERVAQPLRAMGAVIATRDGKPPVAITGAPLVAIDYELPVPSAQVKSAILLAGLYASGTTRVTEPAPTRDHTERMLEGFGYPLVREGERTFSVGGGHRLGATAIDVPADISSAAFFLVGASIAPGSDLTLEHVGINPTRTGVIDILRLMGADIEVQDPRTVGGEPVANLRVRAAPLRGIRIPEALVPLAIDEFPVLFVAAACAAGETVLTGAEELRAKESDRIQVMADGLVAMGIDARPTADGIVIQGGAFARGAEIATHHDHRIAMSFTIAGLRGAGTHVIRDAGFVDTSFPGFVELARTAGIDVRAERSA